MSDAEQAWEKWLRKQNIPEPFAPPSELSTAFFDAYAAASADTARLVRAAVEATREEAANANGDEWIEDCTDEGYFFYCPECDNIKEAGHTASCIKGAIRALDIDAIVARVMQSKEQS